MWPSERTHTHTARVFPKYSRKLSTSKSNSQFQIFIINICSTICLFITHWQARVPWTLLSPSERHTTKAATLIGYINETIRLNCAINLLNNRFCPQNNERVVCLLDFFCMCVYVSRPHLPNLEHFWAVFSKLCIHFHYKFFFSFNSIEFAWIYSIRYDFTHRIACFRWKTNINFCHNQKKKNRSTIEYIHFIQIYPFQIYD